MNATKFTVSEVVLISVICMALGMAGSAGFIWILSRIRRILRERRNWRRRATKAEAEVSRLLNVKKMLRDKIYVLERRLRCLEHPSLGESDVHLHGDRLVVADDPDEGNPEFLESQE